MIGASFNIARANEIRCLSPPESCFPPSPANVSIPFSNLSKNSLHCAFLAASFTSSSLAFKFPIRMFSFNDVLNKN